MTTVSLKTEESPKEWVESKLKLILNLIENCPESMLFKCDIEILAVDPRFHQIAVQISESNKELQKLKEDLEKSDNIDKITEGLKKKYGEEN